MIGFVFERRNSNNNRDFKDLLTPADHVEVNDSERKSQLD